MRCPEALLTAPVAVPALVLLILFFAGSSLGAQILQVPADYPTIQEAIDAAQGGDTVLVAPGTYFENIDFLGKAITVTSILGPQATTIDGGESGSVASFVNGEGQDSLLSGFTITHGRSFSNVGGGGGIRCLFSAPTIEDCRVTDNISDEGAGLRIAGFHPNPLVIRNCTFTGNHSFVNGGAARLDFVEAEIEDCVFAGNTALRRGGGLYLQGGPVTFLRCDIANNTGHYWGGGLYVWDGNVTLEECTLSQNDGGSGGGALYMNGDIITFERCLIADNSAELWGGALSVIVSSSLVTLNHCTIAGNLTSNGAAIHSGGYGSDVTLSHCAAWLNNDPLLDVGGTLEITYSDIQGGFPGSGNIDADPLFVDPDAGDYHLREASPCIDAGDPNAPPDPDGSVADIGVYPYVAPLFRRGDIDGSGGADIVDAIQLLNHLFVVGTTPLECQDAADANDDGTLNLPDVIFLLSSQFVPGTPPLPPPGPIDCGADPTPDLLPACGLVNPSC